MAAPTLIFIGGAPRSGTTLLRAMLDAHPQIAAGPEMRIVPMLAQLSGSTRATMGPILDTHYDVSGEALNAVFRQLIIDFFTPYRVARGREALAEKTPANALHFEELARLFPDAAFVHIIRDGRDVVSSLLGVDWVDASTGKPFAYTVDPVAGAAIWHRHIVSARAIAISAVAYTELRYEDLVSAPEAALTALMTFLGRAFDPAQLAPAMVDSLRSGQNETSANAVAAPVRPTAIGKWRQRLSEEAMARAFAGPPSTLLQALGYV